MASIMMRRTIIWVSFLGLVLSAGALARSAPKNASSFHFGSSCALLTDLSQGEFDHLVHPSNEEYFNLFCQPEEFYDCSDYMSLLYDNGALESSEDGYMCRYIPPENRGS